MRWAYPPAHASVTRPFDAGQSWWSYIAIPIPPPSRGFYRRGAPIESVCRFALSNSTVHSSCLSSVE
jgi:hypothetical protein